MATGRLKAKISVDLKGGEWTAVAVFAGESSFDVKGTGPTLSEALRALAGAIELYFEHHAEAGEAA